MASECAPIALFAFRRSEHLSQCLESLRANPSSARTSLRIFCDGARDEADVDAVERTRQVARAAEGFAQVSVVEQPTNRGLAASVMSGVSEILSEHDRVIVVEDDLVVASDFLEYMNAGLDLYEHDDDVVSIHGFTYAVDEPLPQTFFLRGADCWGWATWRRGWQVFNPDGRQLLAELDERGMRAAFDFDGAYPYRRMLQDQVNGKVDSWAIRWYASAFLAGKVTLYPGRSLVENIGMDGSGTHSTHSESHDARRASFDFPMIRIPTVESPAARKAISDAVGRSHGGGFRRSLRRALRK